MSVISLPKMQQDILFNQALHLSPVDKVRLIDFLLSSFDKTDALPYETEWAKHAERICNDIDAGAQLYPLESVLAELNPS